MINYDNYFTTVIDHYESLINVENETKGGPNDLFESLFKKLNEIVNGILDEVKEDIVNTLTDNSLRDLDDFMYRVYQRIATYNDWTIISDNQLFFKHVIERFYGDSEQLKASDNDKLFERLRYGSFMLINTNRYENLNLLIKVYVNPENKYEELAKAFIIERTANSLSKDLVTILEDFEIIVSGLDFQSFKNHKEVQEALKVETSLFETWESESDSMLNLIFKIIDSTNQLSPSLKNEALYLKIMNTHLSFTKPILTNLKSEPLMTHVLLDLMYSEVEQSAEVGNNKEKRNLNVKFAEDNSDDMIKFAKNKMTQSVMQNEANQDSNGSINFDYRFDHTEESRSRIKKNLKRIFEQYCKLQLTRTCIKSTFTDYEDSISSLKITDYLLFCKDYGIYLQKDEKQNKAELITLYKLLCTSYGLGFRSFKSILEHIALKKVGKHKETDATTSSEKMEILFSYLNQKGFDDYIKTEKRKTRVIGFETTLERSNLNELKEKQRKAFEDRESVYKIENRKTLERRVLKKSQDRLKSSKHLFLTQKKENIASARQMTYKSIDKKENKSRSRSAKDIRPKYAKVNSYYEKAQILKQCNYINNIEWQEINKIRKEQLPDLFSRKMNLVETIQ